jgi:hypothetical protein
MRVYEAYLAYPEVTQFFKPSELYVICRPSFPEEFREELFIKATRIEEKTTSAAKSCWRYYISGSRERSILIALKCKIY